MTGVQTCALPIWVQGLPEVGNVANKRLIAIIFGISLFVFLLLAALLKVFRDLWLTRERERLIYIDPLTGLYNRGYFNLLESSADENDFPQSLFVLDINLLKDINDAYGHHQGDRLIDAVSTILKQIASEHQGTAIRMGGDEFVLLFFGLTEDIVNQIAESLKNTFKATPLMDDDKVLLEHLQVAIGFGFRASTNLLYEDLFKKADHQMYQNKAKMKSKITLDS